MGLSVNVGFLAQVRGTDEEFAPLLAQEFGLINTALSAAGLPPHQEPVKISEEYVWSCDMYGYSGLHYLRRIAAHLALGNAPPPPGDHDAAHDPLLRQLYAACDEWVNESLTGQPQSRRVPFQHLINHSDAEGYYLPVRFENVLVTEPNLKIAGGLIGSAPALLEECETLARALELPTNLDVESEEVWEAADSQGEGGTKWERYGIESFTCLALVTACRKSLASGSAIVFA